MVGAAESEPAHGSGKGRNKRHARRHDLADGLPVILEAVMDELLEWEGPMVPWDGRRRIGVVDDADGVQQHGAEIQGQAVVAVTAAVVQLASGEQQAVVESLEAVTRAARA